MKEKVSYNKGLSAFWANVMEDIKWRKNVKKNS